MKFKATTILPLAVLAATSTAFVIPDEQITANFLQTHPPLRHPIQGAVNTVDKPFTNSLDTTINTVKSTENSFKSALDNESPNNQERLSSLSVSTYPRKPNQSIYQRLSTSKYNKKFTALINEYPDLVEALNSTSANYTIFAPTDGAFEKLPRHQQPSKDIKDLLLYHVSPDVYTAGKVLFTHTIPTLLRAEALGKEPQRLRVSISRLIGLNLNFYSKIIAVNIRASNGIIHGLSTLLVPPPLAFKTISLFPSKFSTFSLALSKTGLAEVNTSIPHTGGTIFAPTNSAFSRLGPKINAFLFSEHGTKYLKALLEYHIAPNQTLYSDAFYLASSTSQISTLSPISEPGIQLLMDSKRKIAKSEIFRIAEGMKETAKYHVELKTLLKNRKLSIDIARKGPLVDFRINGFGGVEVLDGVAGDGVIHVVGKVLIPPKRLGRVLFDEEELEVSDLIERLDPFLGEL